LAAMRPHPMTPMRIGLPVIAPGWVCIRGLA
jgi:hypothetical protein